MSLAQRARAAISDALESLASQGELAADVAEGASWVIERPKRPEHGDLATNVALALAKRAGQPPRAIAEELVRALAGSDVVAGAEVAGPGFVNLRLHPGAFQREVEDILRAGRGWGRAPAATGERVEIEFVSANPTGPVTVASGRNAMLGDTVARLLESQGDRVTREYYVNDRGNQVRAFAESVRAADAGHEPPEDGYKGAYVLELASWLRRVEPDLLDGGDVDGLGRACVTWMLRGVPGSRTLPGIRPSLADLRVHFDVWFSEESLHRWGAVPAVMRQLRDAGYLVEKEGALFFQAPEGAVEDKDRVVRKSDGTWAYFASDIAYFADKIARGYDRLIAVLGADHHGYVARVRNALAALGPAAGALRGAALPARLHHQGRRGGQEQQARRQLRHDRRGDGRDSTRRRSERAPAPTPCGSSSSRGARTRTSSSTSSWPRRRRSTTPSSTSSTATRGSARSSARPAASASPCRPVLWRPARSTSWCTPTSSRSARSSGTSRICSPRPHAPRAAPDRLLRSGACARLSELLHAPEGRERPDPAARQRERGPRLGRVVGSRKDARPARLDRGHPGDLRPGPRPRRRQRAPAHGAAGRGRRAHRDWRPHGVRSRLIARPARAGGEAR